MTTALSDVSLAIDAVILLIALETLLFAVLRARYGVGPSLATSLANGMAGAALLLAARAAALGAALPIIGAWLLMGFAAHIADVIARWRPALGRDVTRCKFSPPSTKLTPERSRV